MSVRHWGIRAVLVTVLLLAFVGALAGVVPAAAVASGGGQLGWSPSLSSFAAASSEARAAGAHPVITRLSLSAAKPGARLTISGRGLGARRGKGSVLFGAFKATSYLRWSATRIVCKVPVIPTGRVLVKVRTAKGTSRGMVFAVRGLPTAALMKLGTVEWTRISSYDGSSWAEPDFLAYYTDSAGNLAIVTQDRVTATLSVSTVNPSTLRRVGDTRTVSLAGWPRWGGFYAGSDGCFYVLVGRENPNEQEDRDVVAVRRYDRSWALLGTAHLGKYIYRPFLAGAPHMVLVGKRLVVHMGYQMFADEKGLRHQASCSFEVDVDSMAAITGYGLAYHMASFSHSFQQLVALNGTRLITIDHGDGPRAILMGVVGQPVPADIADYPGQLESSAYELFAFNGADGDNFTGATVTGLVSGPSGIVVVGSSIRQPDAPNGPLGPWDEHPNVYAIWADPTTGAHTVRWLTGFAPRGADIAHESRVVQVAPDRYAVLFTVSSRVTTPTGYHSSYRMEYRLIDSAGTVLASTSLPGVFFCPMSDPILIAGKVYWVGIKPNAWGGWPDHAPEYVFGIDVSDPTTPSLLSRAAP